MLESRIVTVPPPINIPPPCTGGCQISNFAGCHLWGHSLIRDPLGQWKKVPGRFESITAAHSFLPNRAHAQSASKLGNSMGAMEEGSRKVHIWCQNSPTAKQGKHKVSFQIWNSMRRWIPNMVQVRSAAHILPNMASKSQFPN